LEGGRERGQGSSWSVAPEQEEDGTQFASIIFGSFFLSGM
jgi:hypothetical protein